MRLDTISEITGLLPEEEDTWSDDDVSLGDRGVSLDWVIDFVREIDRHLQAEWEQYESGMRASFYRDVPEPDKPNTVMNQEMTPEFLVPNIISPLTKKLQSPLYARIPLEHRGKPDIFISHPWSQKLVGTAFATLMAVHSPYQINQEQYQGVNYVWLDIISYNQHRVESIASDMKAIISSIGRLGFPMIDASPFTRLWCLWELLCAHVTDSEILFHEPNSSVYDIGHVYSNFKEEFRSIENASTTLRSDRKEILKAMVSTFGSIRAADKYLKNLVGSALSKESDKPWKKKRSPPDVLGVN